MKIRSLDNPSVHLSVLSDDQGDIYLTVQDTEKDPFGQTVRIGGPASGHQLPNRIHRLLYALASEFKRFEKIRFESAAAQMEDLEERQAPVEGPVTIVKDPNNGTYSHGKYLAFPLSPEDIPQAATLKINENPSWPFEGMDDATTVRSFWKYYDEPCGKGDTPDEALKDLEKKLKS